MACLKFTMVSAVFFMSSFIFGCFGAKVQFFENENFLGKTYEANTSVSCTNLATLFEKVSGSLKTTGCVTVFGTRDCKQLGFVIRLQESQLNRLHVKYDLSHLSKGLTNDYNVHSFRDCTDLESKAAIDFNYKNFYWNSKIANMKEYRDICSCTRLPHGPHPWIQKYTVKTFGNCLKLYLKDSCIGVPSKIMHELIHTELSDRPLSVEPCHLPAHCISLKASVFKFEPVLNISDIVGSIKEVTLSAKQTYINNGTAEIEETYSVEKEVTETAEIEYSKSLSTMHSLTFTTGASATVEGGLFGVKLAATLSAELSNTRQSESSSGERKSHAVTTKELFRVDKTFKIPMCTEYEVYSMLQMAENINVVYLMQFKITGESKVGKRLTSDEIIQNLNNGPHELRILFGHPNADMFTLIAETTANIKAKRGINSMVYGVGKPISNCVERHNLAIERLDPSTEKQNMISEHSTSTTSTERQNASSETSAVGSFSGSPKSLYSCVCVAAYIMLSNLER